MKKGIVLLASCIFTLNALAQNINHDNKSYRSKKQSEKYCAILKDGKIIMMHDSTALTSDTTLENGAIVKTNGTVIRLNDTQTLLKNGECVDHNGDLMPVIGKMAEQDSEIKNK